MRCDICYWHQLSPRTAGGCGKGSVFTWGLHPEDVAAEQVKLGSAIFVNPEDFDQTKDDGTSIFLFQNLQTDKLVDFLCQWQGTVVNTWIGLSTFKI